MWPMCTANSFWWLLLPFLIGLLTGWWAWSRRQAAVAVAEPAPAPRVAATPEPATAPLAPVIPVAKPTGLKAAKPDATPAASGLSGAGLAAGAGAAGLLAIGIPAAVGDPDDLLKIKGIGPKLNGILNGLGVFRFDQIANWSASDVDKVDDHLAEFKNRIGREEWIPQAKLLAAGKHDEWERIYGAATKAVAGAGAVGLLAIGIPAAVGDPDDLLKIKGIGPKLNGVLNGLGVTRFDQIAAWGAPEIDKVDDHLESFKGRIVSEEWIPQAKLLSTGQDAEWERIYGTVKKAAGAAAGGAVAMLAIGIPGAVGDPDDLLQIKGIGPKLKTLLTGLGITRFDQIAAWGAAEIDKVDDHLGTFKSRITRDSWVEQAGLLAKGAIAEFEAKFGKLDSENK